MNAVSPNEDLSNSALPGAAMYGRRGRLRVIEFDPDPRGSFSYPEADAFNGSADDVYDFFESTPVDDEVLRRANRAYTKLATESYEEHRLAGSRNAPDDDPEGWNRVKHLSESHDDVFAFRRANSQRYLERWRTIFPLGKSIPPLAASRYVRAVQLVRCQELIELPPAEREKLVSQPPFPRDAKDGRSAADLAAYCQHLFWSDEGML